MERIDVAVIGAGVTGLAAARAIAATRPVGVRARAPSAARAGHQHAQQRRHSRRHLLSRRDAQGAAVRRRRAGCCTSSARDHGVPHARCGKLIVAHDEQRDRGSSKRCSSAARATASSGLEIVDRAFIAAREPHVTRRRRAVVAGHRHRRRRGAGQARCCGPAKAQASSSCPARALVGADRRRRRHRASTPSAKRFSPRTVVNAAGLYADEVSRHARRRDVHDLSVPRRVRGARAGEARRSSTGWSIRCRTRRATASACTSCGRLGGSVLARARRSATRTARTTTRATACRSRRSSSRRDGCSPASRSTICGCRAAASARSCTRRASRSRIS